DGDARTRRNRERDLGRVDPRRCGGDQVRDLDVADRLLERDVVQHVPRASARLPRGRLDEVVLGPRYLPFEELLAAFVVDARVPAVQLREWNELLFGEIGVRHVAAVELIHPNGELRTAG